MLNRLKLFSLVLFIEAATAAGILALGDGAAIPGAAFFGYGRFHFALLAGMLALSVVLAIYLVLLWGRSTLQDSLCAWFAGLRNSPAKYKFAVIASLCGAVLSGLLLVLALFFPKEYQPIVLTEVLPIAAFIVLAFFEIFVLLVLEPDNAAEYAWIGRCLLLVLLAGLLLGYLRGAFDFSKLVNDAPGQGGVSDQLVYMKMMAAAHKSPLTYSGDSARMPLFPLIEALFYNPQAAYLDSFNRAKAVNIYLSILVLAGLFVFFQKSWHSLFTTVNLVLIAAFGVFIFKSAYFLPEVIFYFFGFLSFVYLAGLFVNPSYKNAITAGILTTLAYLSKATALASLAFFAVIWCCALLLGWFGQTKAVHAQNQEKAVSLNGKGAAVLTPAKLILIAGSVLAVFLALLIPFGIQNSRQNGGFFNNLNSSVVMWSDSWSNFKAAAAKYGGDKAMMLAPNPNQPSLQVYIRTHSLAQALQRFSQGFRIELKNALTPFNTVNYPLLLLVVLALVAGSNYKRTLELLSRNKAVVLFVLCYLMGYFVMFCWFAAIDKGPRFVLGLFLPLLFSSYAALFQYRDKLLLGIKRFSILNAVNVLLILLICVDAYIVLSSYLLTGQYGF